MKKLLLIIVSALCSAGAFAQGNAIANYVAALKNDSLLRAASISILVMDAKSNKVIASLNPKQALLPASALKLVTTGLSLVALGPDYKFHTFLAYDGAIQDSTLLGNLYVVGGADPTFGSLETIAAPTGVVFAEWTKALKSNGIKRIDGNLIADETFFAHEETPESWTWGDMGNYYGTCTSGLPFCENAYRVTLATGRNEGDTTRVKSIYPTIPDAVFVNKIKTGKPNSGDNAVIYNSHYSDRHVFTGTVPPKRDSFVVKGSNKMGAYTCLWYFKNYLAEHDIYFTAADEKSVLQVLSEPLETKASRQYIAETASASVKEIAGITNKKSNNFYAETLLKAIGVAKKNNSSYDSSFVAVYDLLDSMRVPRAGFQLRDGSGLSRKDYASAQFLCEFLKAMYHSKNYADFSSTLATPGDTGTLKNVLAAAPNKKRMHAKSGSMEGVRAYAGYSENPGGTIIFAIIINNFNYKVSVLQPKVEQLLQLITDY